MSDPHRTASSGYLPPPPPPPVRETPGPERRATWTGGDIALSLLVGLLGSVVLGFAIVLGGRALGWRPDTYATVGIVGLVIYGCLCGSAYAIIVRFRGVPPESLGLRNTDLGSLLLMVPAAVGMMIVNAFAVLLLRMVLGDAVPTAQQQLGASARMDGGDLLWLLALAAVAAPIAEEFLFRGVLFRWFRNRFSFTSAATITSLLFALAHFTPALVVPYLVFGFVLAFFAERYDSLYPPMLLHALNNGVVIVLVYVAMASWS